VQFAAGSYLSVATVESNLNAIYRKPGGSTRGEAVGRARAPGID